jgi:methylmalonyl-CoA epimerase
MKAVLDHVGIAVKDLAAALAFYRDALGLEIAGEEEVGTQRVRAHFVPVGSSSLELLEATAADSPIARYLDKRGPGLHHVTLRVDDIAAALAQLKARGVRLIDEQPRPGAEHALVAFIHPSSAHGVLLELKQAGRAAPRLMTSRHTLGDLELISVYDGFFNLDGGAIFGMVPKPIWSQRAEPDERNRVRLAMRQLIVRGTRTMLIDAGLGDNEDAAFLEHYGVERERHLDHALAEAGVAPEDIDVVLATHLHFDHAGGFTRRDSRGRLHPRFPRARYVARRGEWEDAAKPNEKSRSGYRAESLAPLVEAGVLELVDQDQTIMPGVRVRRTGGHTMHHQMVMIESRGQQAAFVADLMPTSVHLRAAWISAIDLFPMDTLEFKTAFVDEAVARQMLVFFSHDPVIAAGRLVADGRKVTLSPEEGLSKSEV